MSLIGSKWNMNEISAVKFHLSYVDMPQDFSLENSSMLTPCHFYYWIYAFDQNNSFVGGKFM
jgi:hypothetical protein